MKYKGHVSEGLLRRECLVLLLLVVFAGVAWAETRYESIDEAIARGDLEDVQAHLKADPTSANQGKHPRMTPLQMAILRKKPEIAAVLGQVPAAEPAWAPQA